MITTKHKLAFQNFNSRCSGMVEWSFKISEQPSKSSIAFFSLCQKTSTSTMHFWFWCHPSFEPWVGIQKYGSLIGFCIVTNLYINWDIWVHGKKLYIVNLHILQKLVENGQNLAFKCGFSKKQKWKKIQCFFVAPTCLHYPHSVHDFAFSWINILVIPTNQSD